MKIAFTTVKPAWDSMMEPRFGRAEYAVILDEESKEVTFYNNVENSQKEHGAGPKMAQAMADCKVDVVITGNGPGDNANMVLSKVGIKVFVGAAQMSVEEAYNAYKEGKLSSF